MSGAFSLVVQRDPHGRYAIIRTEGYINNLAGEQIGAQASALMADGFRRLVIDMEKSTVINSIGISILIEVIERMQELHGTLAFCKLTRTIAKTFTIMGLAQYAQIYASDGDAVRGVMEA